MCLVGLEEEGGGGTLSLLVEARTIFLVKTTTAAAAAFVGCLCVVRASFGQPPVEISSAVGRACLALVCAARGFPTRSLVSPCDVNKGP